MLIFKDEFEGIEEISINLSNQKDGIYILKYLNTNVNSSLIIYKK
jgi:hypothetical protein